MPAFSKPIGITRRSTLRLGAALGALAAGGLAAPAIAQTKQLRIINDTNAGPERDGFVDVVNGFVEETGAEVDLSFIDHEAHKTAIRNYLVADAPDVCFWFSGNRMKTFVDRGLFLDISDFVAEQGYPDVLGGVMSAVTIDGKQWGLPLNGTLWGNWYLANVFDEMGLTPPTNWEEALAFGEQAKGKGLVPMTIGTKELWPAAGLFDQFSLRTIGLDNHMALMNGQIAYTDPMLSPIFDHWEELINAGYFLDNHTSFTWQEAAALLGRREAAIINLGPFVNSTIPPEDVEFLTYAPFPKIADIPRFEDFSTDSVHIPARAENPEVAKEFLAYYYRPENLMKTIGPAGAVPPRNDVPAGDNPLVNQAMEALREVEGTAQYYDRDTDPDLAQAGLNGFQEFMVLPDRRDQILARLEQTRQRIYGDI